MSNSIEVLFDIDVMFRACARKRDISMLRPESLNGSFIRALAEVAPQALDPAR